MIFLLPGNTARMQTKRCPSVSLLLLFLFLGSSLGIAPLTGDEENQGNPDCSESILLTENRRKSRIDSEEDALAEPQAKCDWIIVGTEKCQPSLKCKKFKLSKPDKVEGEDPCPDEYLEITDGSDGFQKFCGSEGPHDVIPPNGLREMYMRFRGHKNPKSIKNKGFSCIVACAEGAGKALESNMAAEENKLCECGNKKNNDRIVGGEDADRGEFPWIVALVTAGTRKPFCGGTIVADRFIVTAAHCFKGMYVNKNKLEILAHAHLLDITDTKAQSKALTPEELAKQDAADQSHRFQIEKYFIHPLYVRQTNDFDVAVIKLAKPIDWKNQKLAPACMPELGHFDTLFENQVAIVAGWGLNNSSAEITMATLQKLNVTVFSTPECKELFDQRFTQRMMCAGYKEGGKDSCKGDSGGPLITSKTKNTWQLIGTVSWGEGCAAKNLPGVYTRTIEINQWVRYIVNKEDGIWCLNRK